MGGETEVHLEGVIFKLRVMWGDLRAMEQFEEFSEGSKKLVRAAAASALTNLTTLINVRALVGTGQVTVTTDPVSSHNIHFTVSKMNELKHIVTVEITNIT